MLGPIPTFFHVELVAECGMSAYGNVQATVAGGVDFAGKLGLRYDGDDWKAIKGMKFGKRYSLQVALGGGVTAECSIGPEVTWLIADTAGPSLTAAAYIEGTLDYASECPPSSEIGQTTPPEGTFTKSIEAGLKLVMGIAVEFLGFELGYEEELAKVSWPLYEDIDEVPGVGICQSDCTNGKKDNSETDTDCGGAPSASDQPLCPGCGNGKACVYHLDCGETTLAWRESVRKSTAKTASRAPASWEWTAEAIAAAAVPRNVLPARLAPTTRTARLR